MFLRTNRNARWVLGIAIGVLVAAVGWYVWPRPHTRIESVRQPNASGQPASFEVLKASAAVESLAWSPDGKTLAVQTKPGEGGEVKRHSILLWDLVSGRQYRPIFETSDPIFSVRYSPDGKTLACAAWRRERKQEYDILLWDSETGKEIGKLVGAPRTGLGVPFTSDALCIAFSPDGRWIAAGTKLVDAENNQGAHIGGEICVWNVETGHLKWFDRSTHADPVYAVTFSCDGNLLASAGSDKLIRIWDPETGELKRTLVGAAWDGIGSLAFSPKGKLLASGGSGREEGGIVRIWDAETGDLKHAMSTQFRRNSIAQVVFSPTGQTLFAVGMVNGLEPRWQVHKWEPNGGSHQGTLLAYPGAPRAIAVSPDGKRLAIGTWEGDIILLDLKP